MRVALLLVAVAACSDHPGAYLEVHGGELRFDHVEFFFGTKVSDAFGTATHSHLDGPAYARLLADSDRSVSAGGSATDLTYFVPHVAENAELGEYVLAIASANGTPVGIGEATAFPVPADGYAIVDIPLEPYDSSIETWAPDCLAWNRNHGRGPVGFVHAEDRDCDGEASALDCDDAAFCAPGDPACQPVRMLCTETCAFGCVVDNTCAPRLCMPARTCDPQLCASATTVVDKITCLAHMAGVDHLEIELPTAAAVPCAFEVRVALGQGLACKNPVIEYAEASNYAYTVSDGQDGTCVIALHAQGAMQFAPDQHLLVSFEGPDGPSPRYSILFGINPTFGGCTMTVPPMGTLEINTCQ